MIICNAKTGCIYTGPNYIKRQCDSDNLLKFWYTLMTRSPIELSWGLLTTILNNLCSILYHYGLRYNELADEAHDRSDSSSSSSSDDDENCSIM